jgi:hypothetical protein
VEDSWWPREKWEHREGAKEDDIEGNRVSWGGDGRGWIEGKDSRRENTGD